MITSISISISNLFQYLYNNFNDGRNIQIFQNCIHQTDCKSWVVPKTIEVYTSFKKSILLSYSSLKIHMKRITDNTILLEKYFRKLLKHSIISFICTDFGTPCTYSSVLPYIDKTKSMSAMLPIKGKQQRHTI